MCGKGEKCCPICTEEMDLTDQQLKPCKCGYEICVWCWHHIIEMAEKDGTEGHCPACRTPYDKERIMTMAANCERLVAEMNAQCKKKMQKLKPKASEGRKHLIDFRVIQRNLVYIIGFPLNLADEDLLQHREFFGRYGRVLKVSISRTATGAIQHSANNSCCVYITYSKEAEAVRCIQSVHCFVLEGRSLRACFGTTKYCHAWLRNVPCSNKDCLYLHDYGSQEDSFTKDELVLAFARSRVQQIIGATNNLHRRSGDVLPPPADDPSHISSAVNRVAKSPLDKIENQIKGSCSGSGTGNSTALPAVTSWVMCVSGSLPPDTRPLCSGNSPNRKVEASNDPEVLVSGVTSTERTNLNTRRSGEAEDSSEVDSNGILVPLTLNKHYLDGKSQRCESNVIKVAIEEKLPGTVMSSCETSLADFMGNNQDTVAPAASTSFLELSKPHDDYSTDKVVCLNLNGDVQGLCSGLSSISIHSHLEDTYSTSDSDSTLFTHNSVNSLQRQHLRQDSKYSEEYPTSPTLWEDIIVDDLPDLDYEQPKSCKGVNNSSSDLCSPCLPWNVDQLSHHVWQQDQISYQNHWGTPEHSLESGYGEHVKSKDSVVGVDNTNASDMGESNIISNILSLELDVWEDSLVKLLGESNEQCTPLKGPTLPKVQDKNQSRFSFARQDECLNEASALQHSVGITGHGPSKYFASGGLTGNNDTLSGKFQHVLPSSNSVDKFVGSQSFVPSKFSVSRAHAPTPPGFSVSSRIPPGFPSGRIEQDCSSSVKHLQQHYVPPGNIGRIGDFEIYDPAILEVGKGMLAERLNTASVDMGQTLIPQYRSGEDDARLKLLMQQSLPSQNIRFPDRVGNRFSPQNDAYRKFSRFLDQFQPNNSSIYEQLHSQQLGSNLHTTNTQWGGRNDARTSVAWLCQKY